MASASLIPTADAAATTLGRCAPGDTVIVAGDPSAWKVLDKDSGSYMQPPADHPEFTVPLARLLPNDGHMTWCAPDQECVRPAQFTLAVA